MHEATADEDLERLGALGEPIRRSLYGYVAAQPGPVSRDQAAAALGITRAVAASHLDRLVREQLLEYSFARVGGRSGPGAGRPSKLYRRSAREFEVSLPVRRYELAGLLLAEAASGSPAGELKRVAHAYGRSLGEGAGPLTGRAAGRRRVRIRLERILRDNGFEPFDAPDGSLRLRNCPFSGLARRFPALVCGMNLALMQGLVQGLRGCPPQPELDPAPDRCCVTFRDQARARGRAYASKE